MNTVRDLLSTRDKRIVHVSPYDSVATALRKMSDENIGAILVLDDEEVVGVFSERDYARKLLLHGKSSLVTPIHEVMIRHVLYVTPNYSLEECLALMTKKHLRNLPVIEEGKVLALVSIDDIVEAVLEGKEFMISELTRYVTGSFFSSYEKPKLENIRELVFIKPKKYGEDPAIT